MAFSPDGKYVAMGTGFRFNELPKESELRVWEVATGKEIGGGPILSADCIISCVAYTPDGKSLLAGSHDGTLRVWNTSTWEIDRTHQFPSVLKCIEVSADGYTVALGDGVFLLDLRSGKVDRVLRNVATKDLDFSSSGDTLVIAGIGKKVTLLDLKTGMSVGSLLGHDHRVTGCEFSPDDNTLATIDMGGNLRFWESTPLEQIDRDPITLGELYKRGVAQVQNENYEGAEKTLRYTLRMRQKSLNAEHPAIEETRKQLVRAMKDGMKAGQTYPRIQKQPKSQRVALGASTTLSVECVNPTPSGFRYQWYYANEAIENATDSTLAIPEIESSNLGPYHVEVECDDADLGTIKLKSTAFVVDAENPVASGLRTERFDNCTGIAVTDLAALRFRNQPDDTGAISRFEISGNRGLHYGLRLTGFIVPPESGEYVFYLCSDDSSELYLSSDELPENKRPIARLNGWHSSREWETLKPDNISDPIRLEAGKRYWVEAHFKQGHGRDHLAVTWRMPDKPPPKNGAPPIPGEFLEFLVE